MKSSYNKTKIFWLINMTSLTDTILTHLIKHQPATLKELAQALSLTKADIQYHLDPLVKNGIVVPVKRREQTGRGRKTYNYYISHSSRGKQTNTLLKAFLSLIEEQAFSEGQTDQILAHLARQMIGDYHAPSSPTVRLTRTITVLNQIGYHARWEARPDGAEIIIDASPHAALMNAHPILINLDFRLLSTLLGSEPIMLTMLKPDDPTSCYTFRVNP